MLQLKSYWPRQRVVQPIIAAIVDVHVALPGTSIRSGAMCHFLRLEKYFSVHFHLSVKFRVSTTRNSCQHQSNSVSAPVKFRVSAPVEFRVSTTQYRVSTTRIRVSSKKTVRGAAKSLFFAAHADLQRERPSVVGRGGVRKKCLY